MNLMQALRGPVLFGAFSLLTVVFVACSSKSSSPAPASATDAATACAFDAHGTWNNNVCTCIAGWTLDSSNNECDIAAPVTATTTAAQTGCSSSGGTWSTTALSCTCAVGYSWNSTTNACAIGTTGVAVTQTQCTAASTTGAVWNGSACVCENASYPYFDPNAVQCSITPQTTTSAVGVVTQTQCLNSSPTGALWNGTACQCTNASYPVWSSTSLSCIASTSTAIGTTTVATQVQCNAASTTGAYWNGTSCICESATYPYWNSTLAQCSTTATTAVGTTTNTNTSAVGQVTQLQCQSVASTGASWNGSVCQCTNSLYPFWNSVILQCAPSTTATTTTSTGATAAQFCSQSGGQAGTVSGQCICPASEEAATDSATGFGFCYKRSGNGNSVIDIIKNIL